MPSANPSNDHVANFTAKNGAATVAPPSASESTVLGQEFTASVIKSMGDKTSPRMRKVMSSFIQHIHDFAREVNLTVDEWMLGVEMINAGGKMSNETRNEGQLMCDVIGLESLVDSITYAEAVKANKPLTASAILGPFWRSDTPTRPNGSTMTFDTPEDGVVAFMHGQVTSADTGLPLAGAVVDAWECSTNGLYEQQDPKQQEYNLRGKFVTDDNGRYSFYCLRPTPYPVPGDGPAGKLLDLMDRHHWRPAHIHLIVEAPGHKALTTQIFDSDSKYLEDDSVFAVKENLKVDFAPRANDPQAEFELEYNVSLALDPKA
ncbi:catechol 1,2-dioxygenase [Sporothrix brasiliensis 5110]|uniref:Catechol 1,2-dioxygenase n=1 Tax=Sporothrix brasiliensis 5110 TaxID=1398154 RepID=A0A0C2J5R8_9PEZI|nr:catechol 1,2-dioxygenase [Sporothrix brasiliensis 5110]KIH94340.1 catechol 1,2-dioxygenase [Sporothrix brasiliensis 5110]